MPATAYPATQQFVPVAANQQHGKRSFGWAGTLCRLILVGVLVVMHLPMLIFIGAVCAVGAILKKRR